MTLDQWIHFLGTIGALGIFIVGMLLKNQLSEIRLSQEQSKAELLATQVTAREDLNKKHQENTQSLAVHCAEDREQFKNISKQLDRIDSRLDKIDSKLVEIVKN